MVTHRVVLMRLATDARPPPRSQCHRSAGPEPGARSLTAGWLFSCFRTTPNIDDMAGKNPLAVLVPSGGEMLGSEKARVCGGSGGALTRTPPAPLTANPALQRQHLSVRVCLSVCQTPAQCSHTFTPPTYSIYTYSNTTSLELENGLAHPPSFLNTNV